jgi:translocation and assembly module TamA
VARVPTLISKRLLPGKRFIACASAGAMVLAAAAPALSFELFGRKFFERQEETAIVPDAQPYTLDFNVAGGNEDLTRAVENAASLSRDQDQLPPGTAGLVARARGDYGRILAALYSQGRYGGSIEILVQGQPADTIRPDVELPDPVPVTVNVDPGPPFRFGTIRIEGLPETPLTEEDDDALKLEDWVLVQGEEARSGAILDTEGRLVEFWRQRGHPTARVPTREIVADHRTRTVDVVLAVEPGPAAVLGSAEIAGTERMDPLFVQWMTGIRPGEPYDPDTIRRSRERLQRLGVFSSVAVEEEKAVGPDGILPVTFRVSERKRRLIGGGASYSTVDGAALEAYWMHRNLFGRAESLRLEAAVSRIGAEGLQEGLNYSALATFRKPGVFTPDTDFTFQLGGRREYLDDYESLTVFARPGFERRFSDQLIGRTALNLERSRVEDAFGTNDYLILSLPSEVDYEGSDNKLDPTEGFRGTMSAEPFLEFEQSTVALIASGSVSAYRGFGEDDRVVLAGRAALGSIIGGSLEDIPADRRFFLGGGGSIRGYEFRSVGPRLGDEVVGGLSFWEASVEARFRVTERIGIVPFLDAGAAYPESIPDFSEDIRVGAGLGLRYNTGLGPLRFDVAVPLTPQADDPSVAFYVGLGQAF